MRANPDLSWLDDLPDMQISGVPRVPGVPPQKTAIPAGTPDKSERVTRVPSGGPTVGTRGTPADRSGVTAKPLKRHVVHAVHPVHLETDRGEGPALPGSIIMGLRGLKALRRPRLVLDADRWGVVVADALRLVEDGWARTALAMGWSPVQLWGVGEYFEGVAIELRGRPILTLLADNSEQAGARAAFVVSNVDGGRGYINRRSDHDAARLLWEMA